MIEIKVADADGTTITASKSGEHYAIAIANGETRINFTYDEIESFARELAGAVALWNLIRIAELERIPTPPEVS